MSINLLCPYSCENLPHDRKTHNRPEIWRFVSLLFIFQYQISQYQILNKLLTKLRKWNLRLKFCKTDSKVSTPVSCRDKKFLFLSSILVFYLPFSRYLFKCFIIFLWTFVNYLIQNPYTLPRSHTFHFGNLPNCCLNLTSSTMISSYLLLSITLSLTSLIHSVLLLCSTFWDQTWLQNFLLSAPLGFTTFWLISPSPPPPPPIFSNKSFWLLWQNPVCTNWLFLSSYFWSLVVLTLILCFVSSMTTWRPLFFT